MAPIGAHSLMFIHQGVELFERIRRSRKCGLVGRNVPLRVGFEISKAHAICHRVSLL